MLSLALKKAGILDGDPVIKIPDLDIPVQGAATNFPARVRTSLAQNNKTTNFLAGSAPDEALQAWNQTYLRMPPAARKEWDTEVHGIHQQWRGQEYGAKGIGDALYDHFEKRKLVTPEAWNHATQGNTPAAMAELLGAAVAKHGAKPARRPGQPIATAATPAPVKPKQPTVSKAPVPAAKGVVKR